MTEPSSSSAAADEISDRVAEYGATCIPVALLERAASHARIRAAFDFIADASRAPPQSSGAVAAAAEDEDAGVELTDAAVELLDDFLGRMVDDAAEQAMALALVRRRGAASSVLESRAFPPTAAAASRELLASGGGSRAFDTPAALTAADVEVYLGDVWRHVQLPSTNPGRHLPLGGGGSSAATGGKRPRTGQ